ncbi:MAG: hypothetical protein IIA72_11575 [Proteobacteria bacterium]|nr:hypothetical protein [Pseudomonadota bacterium]
MYRLAGIEGGTAYIFGMLIKEVDPGELAAWETVAESTERMDVEKFLKDYPKGHFAERAKGLLAALTPSPVPTARDRFAELLRRIPYLMSRRC